MITSRKAISWLAPLLAISFLVLLFLNITVFSTARKMHSAEKFLQARHTERELQTAYRKPAEVYPDYASVPEYYRRGIAPDMKCEYQVYQRDGFPYWFFVAALNRQTRLIEGGFVRKLGK